MDEPNIDVAEMRRFNAVELALRMFPQGAGNARNLLDAAREIEKFLSGETPDA